MPIILPTTTETTTPDPIYAVLRQTVGQGEIYSGSNLSGADTAAMKAYAESGSSASVLGPPLGSPPSAAQLFIDPVGFGVPLRAGRGSNHTKANITFGFDARWQYQEAVSWGWFDLPSVNEVDPYWVPPDVPVGTYNKVIESVAFTGTPTLTLHIASSDTNRVAGTLHVYATFVLVAGVPPDTFFPASSLPDGWVEIGSIAYDSSSSGDMDFTADLTGLSPVWTGDRAANPTLAVIARSDQEWVDLGTSTSAETVTHSDLDNASISLASSYLVTYHWECEPIETPNLDGDLADTRRFFE